MVFHLLSGQGSAPLLLLPLSRRICPQGIDQLLTLGPIYLLPQVGRGLPGGKRENQSRKLCAGWQRQVLWVSGYKIWGLRAVVGLLRVKLGPRVSDCGPWGSHVM